MQKTLNGGTIIAYGPTLPDVASAEDGSLFYLTAGTDQGLYLFSLIEDDSPQVFGNQQKFDWRKLSTASASGNYLPIGGGAMTGNLDMQGNKVINVGTPSSDTSLVNKGSADVGDFLNRTPFAGFSNEERTVPVYTNFPLGQVSRSSYTSYGLDKNNREVIFYTAADAALYYHVYMGYRYTSDEDFTFINEPVTVPGIQPGEFLSEVISWGPGYAACNISLISNNNVVRTVLFDTFGSTTDTSQWTVYRSWTAAQMGLTAATNTNNVSIAGNSSHNFALTTINGVKYALHLEVAGGYSTHSPVVLHIENQTTRLRSLTVFNPAEIDRTDRTGAGRTFNSAYDGIKATILYTPRFVSAPSFIYHPDSGKFMYYWGTYTMYNIPGQTVEGLGLAVTLDWTIPSTWVTSGTGAPVNNITVKAGGYRYRGIYDETWNTASGGFSTWQYFLNDTTYTSGMNVIGTAGRTGNMSVNNLGDIYICDHGIWDNFAGCFSKFPSGARSNVTVGTIRPQLWYQKDVATQKGAAITLTYPPTGSRWSRVIQPPSPVFIGDTALISGDGSGLLDMYSTTTFNTSSFNTTWATDDTIKLNATGAVNLFKNAPVEFMDQLIQTILPRGTLSISTTITDQAAGLSTSFVTAPGWPIWVVTATGGELFFRKTALIFPVIPTSLGVLNADGYEMRLPYTWNGSETAPAYYAMVKAPTDVNSITMVRNTSGTWIRVGGGLFTNIITVGQNAQGSTATIPMMANTEGNGSVFNAASGQWYNTLAVSIVAAAYDYPTRVNVNTLVYSNRDILDFIPVASGTDPHGQPGTGFRFNSDGVAAFGFSRELGMFHSRSIATQDAVAVMSQKNLATGATFTEEQWWTNRNQRFLKWMTTTPSVGLVAYLTDYPIFIGGYVCRSPGGPLELPASSTCYVILEKVIGDRTSVRQYISLVRPEDSFSRVCIAEIVTDDLGIVSTRNFPMDEISGSAIDGELSIQYSIPNNAADQIRIVNADGKLRWDITLTEADAYNGSLNWQYHDANEVWIKRLMNFTSGGIYIDGYLQATGTIPGVSDSTLKTDVKRIENALEKVDQIGGYTYERIDTGKLEVGVIAQEVEQVLPEAVYQHNAEDMKSVAYGNMMGLLIEATKELRAKILDLKARIKALK